MLGKIWILCRKAAALYRPVKRRGMNEHMIIIDKTEDILIATRHFSLRWSLVVSEFVFSLILRYNRLWFGGLVCYERNTRRKQAYNFTHVRCHEYLCSTIWNFIKATSVLFWTLGQGSGDTSNVLGDFTFFFKNFKR